MTEDEIRGIPKSRLAKWIEDPEQGDKLGIMRRHGHVSNLTSKSQNPETRRKLTEWDENACSHLMGHFRDMLNLRAALATQVGRKCFFDLMSESSMLDRKSVGDFLDTLSKSMKPQTNAWMADLLEMKLQDMGFWKPFSELRNDLAEKDLTIRDFQEQTPRYRLHWGDVSYYSILKRRADVLGGQENKFHHYFPTHTTARKPLETFGHVFGLIFKEILPEHESYVNAVECYSKHIATESGGSSTIEGDLLVFNVEDDCGRSLRSRSLGVLVLDLLRKPGKRLLGRCTSFGEVRVLQNP